MSNEVVAPNYQIADFTEIEPTPCPCGYTRRAFMNDENTVASMHIVEIAKHSRVHYHKKMTELYHVLEGEGTIELDGERYPLKPGSSILIKPGCRHRAVGEGLKILNVPVPKFDPEDEWFDD
ncbi:MAG: cupin domain-containing protein [Verrucomicrobiota bacterium]